jgi:hypothetical protein
MAFVAFGVRCKRIKESWSGLAGTDESGQQMTKGGYGMSNIQGFPGERWESGFIPSAKRRDSGSFKFALGEDCYNGCNLDLSGRAISGMSS